MTATRVRRRKPEADEAASTTEARRAAILEAAAKAFMTNGFAATSIDTVAGGLGCTKGLIYYHFRNKADLFFAIHRQALEENLAAVRPIAANGKKASARLREMAKTHALDVMRRLPLQRVAAAGLEMHLSGSTTPEERDELAVLTDLRQQYEKLFADVIGEGIKSGEFRKGQARILAKPMLGALNSMTGWYQPRPREDEAARLKLAGEVAEFVVQAVLK